MQSVRYLARDVIMEFPMPSIENRLGGISKYVLRDKAGNGLFMVYDPSKKEWWRRISSMEACTLYEAAEHSRVSRLKSWRSQ